ncbi:YhbY family RNA-binding protein [Ferriphaselus sp. R-1]|jgi:putative YhbY family RNA-binding protein|uniref:YhbY family RNA-binding protein n=1 Tax=Ferriphaselus sp. R-1 TaxID=1485544 RepID=UPI00054D7FAA|nr:YhbY family RNA-binding protein [Ferriphaselus sp. R-1]
MLSLTVAQRLELKARAHALNPVILIGNAGLTEAVLAETAIALKSHELIKVRVMGDDRAVRGAIMEQICEQLDAAPVQQIGKMLVIYKPNLDATMPIKKAPRRDKKPLTKKQLANR